MPIVREGTIAAVSTPSGRGAIGVVRVSGRDAERICRRVVSPWPTVARRATRCHLHAPDDASTLIDDGLATFFPAPRSYTGEPMVELGTHGGWYVPEAVLAALIEAGARPAAPGEFSERAVLNGKFDLVRAEAIAELVDARSRATHRAAIDQLSGALSRRFDALRNSLLELEALLAYDIDFPDEDGGQLSRSRVQQACAEATNDVTALLATVPAAILGREGATVVLAGPPNAGKSSLLNALVGESRVIVSDTPGTTRDAVEVLLEHDPWPLRLVDTAGLHRSNDPVERLGMEVSERYLGSAHAVVVCADSAAVMRETGTAIGERTGAPLVGARTKSDLVTCRDHINDTPFPVVMVSAVRGDGLTELLAQVTRVVSGTLGRNDPETPVVTRARHRAALERARAELLAFRDAWEGERTPAPVAAAHVRAAVTALDGLMGAIDVDDVFARVFSTFCIGK